MTRTFRLAMAQINTTVGDIEGNTRKVIDYIDRAKDARADLVAFPELTIPGYPPEDLLFKKQFVNDNLDALNVVADAATDIAVVVGFVDADSDIHNSAAVAFGGEVAGVYHKMHLPNYGVFDEERYFSPGNDCQVYVVNGTPVGVNICEDIWNAVGPTVAQRAAGAELIVNISGSPYYMGKLEDLREKMLSTRAADNGVFVAYVNLVGGQDELVFDGASFLHGPSGELVARGNQFEEELIVLDLDVEAVFRSRVRDTRPRTSRTRLADGIQPARTVEVSAETNGALHPLPALEWRTYGEEEEVYAALVLGTRDYVHKTGFEKVFIALSGGIDSSMVAAIAVDALGAENVTGVAMPSRYSSEGSVTDATALTENLGIELWNAPIEAAFTSYLDTLAPHFEGTEPGVAEENVQSRIRGNLIMALANKFDRLVLTTGNKSEMAVGYATIYGDMAGGYAVIKDVPKTLVYRLAEHRNGAKGGPVIPQSVIDKPPSAELRPDQTDQDTLPPYEVLDTILEAYVEDDLSFDQIVEMGHDEATVKRIITMVDRNEYKRRQAPPGIKITPRNFGRDRRMPIANRYRPF